MAVLNHHIVSARDAEASATFFTDVLGLDNPVRLGHPPIVPSVERAQSGYDRTH